MFFSHRFRSPTSAVNCFLSQIFHIKCMNYLGIIFLNMEVHHSITAFAFAKKLFVSEIPNSCRSCSKCDCSNPFNWKTKNRKPVKIFIDTIWPWKISKSCKTFSAICLLIIFPLFPPNLSNSLHAFFFRTWIIFMYRTEAIKCSPPIHDYSELYSSQTKRAYSSVSGRWLHLNICSNGSILVKR